MEKPILSKSTFIKGLQCEKSLYLYKHHYNLKDETPAQLQAIFNQGHRVGELAQDLFPGGVDASPSSYYKIQESVFKTVDFIQKGEPIIYEATFQFNGVIAALDILVKDEDGWKAYEVKSSTSVSDVYVNDAAIQYYTIVNSGIDLKDISIVYINNQYIKQGNIDIEELFTIESVYDRVQEVLPKTPNQIERFKEVIKEDEVPDIDIGPHCSKPYDCDFKGYCWSHIPDYSVFNISRLNVNKKFELYQQGVISFEEIDLNVTSFNSNQLLQVTSELNSVKHIDKKNISTFLEGLNYPLYFLDFETMGSAIPIYDNTRPYQQFVFQYSLHILQQENSVLDHFEYLAETKTNQDPRIGFVKQLITDCGNSGDILVYNIGFERGKLNDLISVYPQYSIEINSIINRLKDLMIPFQQRWYYTPEMKGSYSIKYVLPALVPDLSYQDLEIKEGGTASTIFAQMASGDYKGDYEKTRQDLLAYCKLDTYAMVKIYEVLKTL
ncbi:protein of unknown function [Formosa sp. Hel1_31_208]|uniref:DUF2779 domain-containing protein n=1 Tax=Formosa sp. Hel1_31_208 TaxID=1798225 RepID=UPI000879DC17|nr:DUF2779 domain-containing protein [Formosa sp. Hel1_31_208]SDR90623.1 protein of unknown function [Formosa sp. Hel1_31_208]